MRGQLRASLRAHVEPMGQARRALGQLVPCPWEAGTGTTLVPFSLSLLEPFFIF